MTSLMVQMVKNLPAIQEIQVRSLGWTIPWRRKWQPTPAFLPGEFHGQRSLAGYSPWNSKESDMMKQLTLSPPLPHLTDEDSEVQEKEVTCPWLHLRKHVGLGFQSKLPDT